MKKTYPFWFLLVTTLSIPYVVDAAQDTAREMIEKDQLIKAEVETAISMLGAIEMKHQQGEMTLTQAKQLGADLLRALRYGTEGYFWADTEHGVNVVLYGRSDVEGKTRLDAKDANGVAYIRRFIVLGKSGGGYVEYLFPKKGETQPLPKRSYVKAFKPFGWIVGSGYYRTQQR